jgi:hypothetical protein
MPIFQSSTKPSVIIKFFNQEKAIFIQKAKLDNFTLLISLIYDRSINIKKLLTKTYLTAHLKNLVLVSHLLKQKHNLVRIEAIKIIVFSFILLT